MNLGELKGAWKIVSKNFPPTMTPKEVDDRRIMFYMGAHTYQSIVSNASKLPGNYPEQVINSTDRELDEFKAEMHANAQRVADAARAKELAEADAEPGGLPETKE